MILEVDGLAVKWSESVPIDYETMDDCEMNMPEAIQKKSTHLQIGYQTYHEWVMEMM